MFVATVNEKNRNFLKRKSSYCLEFIALRFYKYKFCAAAAAAAAK